MRGSSIQFLGILLMMLWCTGCYEITAGPCSVEYGEAVLHITSVRDATTNEQIAEITISRIEFDGRSYPLLFGLTHSQNIELRDSVLVCTVPFSFGTGEGTYVLAVSAEGYVDRDLEIVDAHYSVHEGPGCPMYLDGGTRVQFAMGRKKGHAS